jgi:hypothetical protein
MESYKIVIPSRNRVKNIPQMLSLLPGAMVCVHRSERSAYAEVVPKRQLLTHTITSGLTEIRNWISQEIKEDVVIQVDDDLKRVLCLTKPHGERRIKNPVTISGIIENTLRVSGDLGIPVFCWSRIRNRLLINPMREPIRCINVISSSFGLRGAARERKFDSKIIGRADLDFALRTLLEDRILYADMRFFFDHGRIFAGAGGNAGLLSQEQCEQSTERLQARWGRWVRTEPTGLKKKRGADMQITGSIRIRRRNPIIDGA